MAVRPKVRTSNGTSDYMNENLSCGFVRHQYKGIKCKMRWGQLWTGKNDDDMGRCTIRLFKYEIANPKPGTYTKKDLKEKVSFDFLEEDFCGLEKGEHYTQHGMRRYICIILKSKHLIVQDAITAMTDTDHDVIGTWYKKISQTMKYVNRWKVFREQADVGISDIKFLHLSKENMCECFSLHNSSVGQKGRILLDNLWKTKTMSVVEEIPVSFEGIDCSRITFHDSGADCKTLFLLHGVVNLSPILQELNRKFYGKGRVTLCTKFDDLKLNPNLIKIPPKQRQESQPMNLRQLSYKNREKSSNPYVQYDQELDENPEMMRIPMSQFTVESSSHSPGADPVSDLSISNNRQPDHHPPREIPLIPPPRQPIHEHPKNNGTPPRHHTTQTKSPATRLSRTDNDSGVQTKLQDTTTELSVDSGYLTSEHLTLDGLSSFSREDRRYNNLRLTNRQDSPVVTTDTQNSHYMNVTRAISVQNEQVDEDEETPPAIPARDDLPDQTNCEDNDDLITRALRSQQLMPIDTNPDTFRPGYETSMIIEVTIAELLRNGTENYVASLGLPYSVYMSLVLGMERESVSLGNWRGLASALQMSFRDVEQIESAVRTHSTLYPAQILLLHWYRTQAPYPFTRLSLKKILEEVMHRSDLAELIHCEEGEEDKEEQERKD